MATTNFLPVKAIFCTLAFFVVGVSAQTLEPRTRCTYEKQTNKIDSLLSTVEKETCIEDPGFTAMAVKIGDLIRLDYVQPHPVIKNDFYYQNSRCRWFMQSGTGQRNLVQYQGVICQLQSDVWRVIDKF